MLRAWGGSALYETSPLQRRLRDLHAAGQHAAVQQRHYVGAGKLLLSPNWGQTRPTPGKTSSQAALLSAATVAAK